MTTEPPASTSSPIRDQLEALHREYAQIHAAARLGWLDLARCRHESVLAIKRAGANLILNPSASNEQRSQMGKTGWDLAERAITANPAAAEGYYWAAVNMGSYALGLGVVRALTLGLEGKFKDRLGRAGALAPAYQFGGVDLAWGRFYEKLPWPKRAHSASPWVR